MVDLDLYSGPFGRDTYTDRLFLTDFRPHSSSATQRPTLHSVSSHKANRSLPRPTFLSKNLTPHEKMCSIVVKIKIVTYLFFKFCHTLTIIQIFNLFYLTKFCDEMYTLLQDFRIEKETVLKLNFFKAQNKDRKLRTQRRFETSPPQGR